MKTNRIITGAIGAFLVLGTAACGSAYDRDETIDDLMTDSGLTEEQATCIVDRLEDEIGEDRLGERGVSEEDLTEEELETFTNAFFDCALGGG